jgi:hypothetical protein
MQHKPQECLVLMFGRNIVSAWHIAGFLPAGACRISIDMETLKFHSQASMTQQQQACCLLKKLQLLVRNFMLNKRRYPCPTRLSLLLTICTGTGLGLCTVPWCAAE